jgi:hypothetical protein
MSFMQICIFIFALASKNYEKNFLGSDRICQKLPVFETQTKQSTFDRLNMCKRHKSGWAGKLQFGPLGDRALQGWSFGQVSDILSAEQAHVQGKRPDD